MALITGKSKAPLDLGRQGENLARTLEFDVSEWRAEYGEGTVQLLHQRHGDAAPYPAAIEREGDVVRWPITAADTACNGYGFAQLLYFVGDVLAKQAIYLTHVVKSLGQPGEVPEAQKPWVEQVLAEAAKITGMTATAVELPAGAEPTAEYADGVLTIGIPQGGDVPEAQIAQAVADYLAENPIEETDPTVPAWAKQPEKPSYTADEVGALSAETLPEAINTALAQAKASGAFDGADGKDGLDGSPGADGKSAYKYAVDGGYTGTEAGFAARLAQEMPTALPNPQPLTINGTQYDGSAAVDVTVTGGGTGVEVDDTLSKAGAAADAAAVGDQLSAFSEEIADCIKSPAFAEVGQIVKIAAVDDAGKPTAWEAVDLPAQVQADWNQNDSTAADYVKNRPFYSETRNMTVENAVDVVLEGFPVFSVGDTVTVNVDGVEHSLVAYDDEGAASIGDTYSSIDSGEGQFGWQIYVWGDEAYFVATEAHTVSYLGIDLHKINDKFLNFGGLVRTFDYYFGNSRTLYKTLYDDDGIGCLLYTCNDFILPEAGSQLFGFISRLGLSSVDSTGLNSCYINGYEITTVNGSVIIVNHPIVIGLDTVEMEVIAADYGFTHTTNPKA